MVDLSLAASPPAQVRPAVTRFTPPKVDEPEAFAVDFEKALRAQKKEMRDADASRTTSAASHQKPVNRPEHSPKTGSPGEMKKVQAAGNQRDTSENELEEVDSESGSEAAQSLEAGAAAVQPQTQPSAEALKNTEAAKAPSGTGQQATAVLQTSEMQTSVVSIASTASEAKAASAEEVSADGQAAQTVTGQASGAAGALDDVAKPVTAETFVQALQSAQQAGEDKNVAAVSQAAAEAVEQQAVHPAVTVSPQVDPAQTSAEAVTSKSAKAAGKIEASALPTGTQTSSSAPAAVVVAQNVEVKALGGTLFTTDAQSATAARPLEMMEQVARAVEASLQQGKNTLRMQLNPADLGAIDIRLVSSGHRVSMSVIAEQASTGRLLENQMEQLRQTLADAGVQLTQMHVGQQNQNGHFSRNFAQQQPQANLVGARLGSQGLSDDAETAIDRPARLRGAGAVDYRV